LPPHTLSKYDGGVGGVAVPSGLGAISRLTCHSGSSGGGKRYLLGGKKERVRVAIATGVKSRRPKRYSCVLR
jgi:hypothetical protein